MPITDALNNLLKAAREYATTHQSLKQNDEVTMEDHYNLLETRRKLQWASIDYNKAYKDAGLD